MLRSLVLLLALANAVFFAWSQGWLGGMLGSRQDAQREPQRLAQQVQAEQLIVLPPGAKPAHKQVQPAAPDVASEASAAEAGTPASAPPVANERTVCLEAGPFTTADYPKVEGALKPLLANARWSTDTIAVQGLWLVYMGPFTDPDVLARKQAELRKVKGVDFTEVKSPPVLAGGLSLGRFNKEEDARQALESSRQKGVRSAKVVLVRSPAELQVVRVPKADSRTREALKELKLPQGKAFSVCR